MNFHIPILRFPSRIAGRLRALSRDERGTISILSVITIFVLAVVLGMVVNAGRQVDEKVRMQNAADAATYSGGVVVARGLNALAFANHVEAEVFALTAYWRAARDAGPRKDPTTLNMENAILDAWNTIGAIFSQSSFPKFQALGPAIQQKVPLEKAVVKDFLTMSEMQSALVLPVFESILRGPNSQPGGAPDLQGGVIPRFQRAVVLTTPQAAQAVANEIARMHGNMTTQGKSSGLEKLHGGQPLTAVLWRTNGNPISLGNEQDPFQRTLPVFDPTPTGTDAAAYTQDYYELARCQRRSWANNTLTIWNQYLLDPFFRGIPLYNPFPPYNVLPGGASAAKSSTLYYIWQIYTCGQLNKLLEVEYHATNLPFVYRMAGPPFNSNQQCQTCQTNVPDVYDCNCMEGRRGGLVCVNGVWTPPIPTPPGYLQYVFQNMDPFQNPQQPSYLEQYHMFVGVVYWPKMQQTSPVFFRYPLSIDSMAFAQTSVFIPKRRYVFSNPWGAVNWLSLPYWVSCDQMWEQQNIYDNWPQMWDQQASSHPINLQWIPIWNLENQNWMAKLVPATSDGIPMILQSSQAQQFVPGVRVPNLGSMTASDMRKINTH
jgi:hypothetical protein